MNKLTFDRDNFYLDGKPFRMVAGDIPSRIIILDIDPVGDRTEIKFLDREMLEGQSIELS